MPIEITRAGEDDYGSFIKILIVGEPGSGKTRHSSCWPDPLFLNAEAGLMSIRDRNSAAVKITSTSKVTEVIATLQQPPDIRQKMLGIPVRTVVLDTVDEVARLFVKERLATEKKETLAIQDWGWLGDQLRSMIRALRNLDMHVVLCVHAKSQEDSDTGRTFVKPGIQGAMGDEIAGYVDIAVLLQARPVVKVVKGESVKEIVRYFQTYPDPIHPWVKDRSGALPMEFPINFNDDFERLDTFIFGGQAAKIAALAEVAKETAPVVEGAATQVTDTEAVAAGQTKEAAAATKEQVSDPAPEPEVSAAPTAAPAETEPDPQPTTVVNEPESAQTPGDDAQSAVDNPVDKAEPEAPAADPVPDSGTPVAVAERHPEGTYSSDADAVAADCPKGYGCIVEKDMADLTYIRFRKRMCRSCFAEEKAKAKK